VSFDRTKALQSAQKYLAKGQFDRAITEYERLVQSDPKDARLLLKLGDLYTRQGASKEASATYRKVAEQYAEQGFFLKAVAVCKQILKLDPNQLDIWERLAEMYEMLSLVSDAIATYEQVADAYTRNGNPRKALKAMQKSAELDVENVAARIRYAEALSKLNKPDEAAVAFREGAELLKKQGRLDDFLKVGERLLFHQQDNYEFARELAAVYLERNDAKHALAKLQACFNADPKSLDTLLLLARAFEQLGQTPKTVSVLKEVARLHASESRLGEQGSVLRRILTLDPSDTEARRDLSQIKRLPSEQSSSAIEVSDDDYDLVLEDDEIDDDDDDEPELSAGHGADGELEPRARAEVQRLLDECAVFIRYGLTEKMITQLQEVLSIDPRHIDAREKLKDALVKARRPADAAKELITLADQVTASEPERAENYLSEALRLDPHSDAAKQRMAALATALDTAQHTNQDTSEDTVIDNDDVIFVDETTTEHPQAEHEHATARMPDSGERPEESFASVMPQAMHSRAAPGMTQRRDAVVVIEADSEDAVLVVDDDDDDAAAQPTAAARADEEPPEELREALEEVEFYLKQGLGSEAGATLADALESFPNHPRLLAYQSRIADPAPRRSITPPPAPVPVAAKPAAIQDRSFELAQKLAEEVSQPSASGSGPVDLAEVLAQFKRGVAKQVDKADAATHYDLGIAYMEMGLNVEAIDEFKLCLDDPQRGCTAHTMIGLSFVAKGDMDLGVEHFKQALASKPKPTEEVSLWFEMGNAYELLGKNLDALVWYEKVEERDSRFRDVLQRIERLGTARTPEQESDDFDEMFDNMILKE
jgi:tetratricopeptide (TPR) repeat protein